MNKWKTIIVLLILFPGITFADSLVRLDSLQKQLNLEHGIEKAKTLILMSETVRSISYTDCINYGMQAIEIAKNEHNKNIEGEAYKSLGVSCYYLGDLQQAHDYFKKGLEAFRQSNNLQGVSNCLNNMGLLYEEWSVFDSAYSYYKQSLALEEQLGNKKGMALSLINMGNIGYYRKNYKQSLDNYYRAMLLFHQGGDIEGEGRACNNLGIIYWLMKKPDKGNEYYMLAEELFKKAKDYRGLARTYVNLAELYSKGYKKYKTALDYYNKALDLKKKLDEKEGIALIYNDLGALYADMEDTETAASYFEKSLELYKKLNSKKGIVMVLYNYGKLYHLEHKLKDAIKNFNLSLNMAKEIGYVDYYKDNYESLFRCYAELGEVDSFNYYFKQYKAIEDSLSDKLRDAQIRQIEAKYQVDELLKQKENIEKQKLESEQKLRKYRLILTGVAGALILLIITYLVIVNINRTAKRDK